MIRQKISQWSSSIPPKLRYLFGFLALFFSFFLIELFAFVLLKPNVGFPLIFGALWSGIFAGLVLFLPRLAGRIVFGILYYIFLLWVLAQSGYYQVFDKMMWTTILSYANEGALYLGDVLGDFSIVWWLGFVLFMALGVCIIVFYPHMPKRLLSKYPLLLLCAVLIVGLCILPEQIFKLDTKIGSAEDDTREPTTYRSTYESMYSTKEVYNFTGIYQLTARDIWFNHIYPHTAAYDSELNQQKITIDSYFAKRGKSGNNKMTGAFAGKNVILVLMESMDDWMITEEETPTIKRLMDEGINFTNFYTPGYGSARTLNSEFCVNTGIYIPTTGNDVLDYLDNNFGQSIASQLGANGYSSYVFHYNNRNFYKRGELEPAMGYKDYISYSEYVTDNALLCQDTLLFDLPQVSDLFFRDGPSFNTIITRAAHLGYVYNEIIDYYALKEYPEYRGKYPSEEEDCARLKAMLVDKMFQRLLAELEERGQLENTVIIGVTDHYTYGYVNMDELYAHSGVSSELLLEKTPCFIWSADGPTDTVTKTLNTSDFLPTMLNLLGIHSPYFYLGQDAYDPNYKGYALFPDGSWICDGVAWQNGEILMNEENRVVTQEEISAMEELLTEYRNISNLLLTCNYYK